MKYTKTLSYLLAGIWMGMSGCHKEDMDTESPAPPVTTSAPPVGTSTPPVAVSAPPVATSTPAVEVPATEIPPEEVQLQERLDRIKDWRSFLNASSGHKHIETHIKHGINQIKDPGRRMEYFNRFFETAFSFAIDATDPGTRTDQMFAFSELSETVADCAYARDDQDNFWETHLRRLRRIQEEMRRVEEFFKGTGGQETFRGTRDDWKDYRRYVRGEYGSAARSLSGQFGTIQTADFLTYERWLSIRSQLEEILGHKVQVWDCVLKKWQEQQERKK